MPGNEFNLSFNLIGKSHTAQGSFKLYETCQEKHYYIVLRRLINTFSYSSFVPFHVIAMNLHVYPTVTVF